MKKIRLTNNKWGYKYAILDDEDFEKIRYYNWHANRSHNTFYAATNIYDQQIGRYFTVFMHNLILFSSFKNDGNICDHINGDGLNNLRSNLRKCNHIQNCWNRSMSSLNTTGFKGVTFRKDRKKYRAGITCNKKHYDLGHFDTAEEAYKAYKKASDTLYGDFSKK